MKILTRFLALVAMLAFAGTLQAQITISEGFEGVTFPPTGWAQTGAFGRTTTTPCTGVGVTRKNLWSSSATGTLTTLAGTSNGQNLTISFNYKLLNFSGGTALPNAPAWGNITASVSIDGGTTFPITAGVIDPSNHVASTSCANRTYSVPAASVPNGSSVKVRWTGTWAVGDYYIYLDDVSIAQASLVPPPCATTPSPANGATGVNTLTSLSWAAAAGATSYDVYFGTSPAPPFVVNQAGTSYNPGTLAGNTTYYFQVIPKNVNGSAAACTVWSFTTIGCPTGLGTGVSNVTLPYNGTGLTTCGNVNDLTSTNVSAVCGSANYYTGEDNVYIFTPSTSATYLFSIAASGANSTYVGMMLYDNCPVAGGACVANVQSSTGSKTMTAALTSGTTYYLIVDTWTAPVCITSFTLTIDLAPPPPACATLNTPTNGATGVATNTPLTWTAGAGPAPTAYKVYLGTVNPPVTLTSTVTAPTASYTPIGQVNNTTYYWYIVPTNAGGDAVGCNATVYSYTTAPPPPVPNCATLVSPANAATNVVPNTPLTWTAPVGGGAPASYKVYLGTVNPPPTLTATVTAPTTSYTPSGQALNTTYYWYVVPSNVSGDAVGCNGTVFSYTTQAAAMAPVNDECITAVSLTGSPGVFVDPGPQSSQTATQSQAPIVCNGFTASTAKDVWYSLTTDPNGGDVTITITTSVDIVAEFFTTAGSCSGASVCSDATGGGETFTVTGLSLHGGSTPENTATYFLRIYPYGGAVPYSFSIAAAGSALPLELKSFTGRVQATANVLSWETLTEKNVQSHIVERSVDGTRWSEVGRKAGQVDSQVSVKYSLEDRAPIAKAYYRLRSVDFDGKESRSNTIVLTRKGDEFGITSVYPSPTNGNVTVQFNATEEEAVTIRVMDMTGRLVMQQVTEAVKDINELPLTLTGLQAGVYTVTVANSTGVSAPVRFVKQ